LFSEFVEDRVNTLNTPDILVGSTDSIDKCDVIWSLLIPTGWDTVASNSTFAKFRVWIPNSRSEVESVDNSTALLELPVTVLEVI
jgi:hypothetical protein